MHPGIEVFGYSISTYFLVISLSISLSLVFLKYRADRRGLPTRLILDISLGTLVAGLLGSRLFHILFEEPSYYLENPLMTLALNNGGYVYYGGFICGALYCILALRYKKQDLPPLLDCVWAPLALGYGLGRIGCFLAGCCYGRFCELPWAIQQRHPTQLYAVLWELILLLILLRLEKAKTFSKQGQIFYTWLGFHALGRLMMESFRADFRGPEYLLSFSSWISLVFIIFSVIFLIRSSRRP